MSEGTSEFDQPDFISASLMGNSSPRAAEPTAGAVEDAASHDASQKQLIDIPEYDGPPIVIAVLGTGQRALSPDVQWVMVTSKNYLHKDHCIAALEAGKYVFCEKPEKLKF